MTVLWFPHAERLLMVDCGAAGVRALPREINLPTVGSFARTCELTIVGVVTARVAPVASASASIAPPEILQCLTPRRA